MSLLLLRPSTYPIIRRNHVLADKHRIVSIRDASYHFSIIELRIPSVLAQMMCAERI